MRRPSSDDRSPDRDRFDFSFHQLLDQAKWWGRRNHALVLRGWIVDDRAVLGDDEIEDLQLRKSMRQVRDLPTGQQYQPPAGRLELLHGVHSACIDKTMIGNRAVVIAGQGEEVQGELRYNAGTAKVQDATRGALPQLQLRQPLSASTRSKVYGYRATLSIFDW